jgi:hypothetical protein
MTKLFISLVIVVCTTAAVAKPKCVDLDDEASDTVKFVAITFSLLSLFMLPACQTVELKADPNESSIAAGYSTVESNCGTRAVGPNACVVHKGQPTKEKYLTVRTVQSGVLSVFSSECGIDWSTRYSDSSHMAIPLAKLLGPLFEKTCLLTIVINPEYDDQDNALTKVHGFKGEVLVKVLSDGEPATLHHNQEAHKAVLPLQVRESGIKPSATPQSIVVDVNGSEQGMYGVRGCGNSHSGNYHSGDTVNYRVSDFQKPCVYHGAIVPMDQKKDLLFSVMVNTFKNDYIPLDIPDLIVDGKNLLLDFDKSVSFVELGDKSYNKTQVSINRYDREQRYEVRAYTVKGRYVVGVHEHGDWKWYR